MNNIELDLQHEIELVFEIQKNEIKKFKPLIGFNHVYSFIVKNEKYVVHKLIDTSIMNWEWIKIIIFF